MEHSCPSKTRFPKGGKTTSVLQPRPFCCCTAKTSVVKSEILEISCIPSRRVDTLPLVAYAQSANQPILHWELLRLPPGRHSRSHLCRRRFAHRLPTLLSSEACCHHFIANVFIFKGHGSVALSSNVCNMWKNPRIGAFPAHRILHPWHPLCP